MDAYFTIGLQDVRIRSFHGLFPEEQKTGNEFLVSLTVRYPAPDQVLLRLDETVDYGVLHDLLLEQMRQREDLLETVAARLLAAIRDRFPSVVHARVDIRKLHPPITGYTGTVSVCLEQNFPPAAK